MLPREDRTHLGGIYQIRCVKNGKVYIGSAACFGARWSNHRFHLRRGSHHSRYLQASWRKYGPDQFVFEIVAIVDDADDLIRVEQAYLDRVKPFDRRIGFNASPTAGSPRGMKASDETRARMSAAQKGKVITPEHRATLSKLRKNDRSLYAAMHTPEAIAKGAKTRTGRALSEETRAKISQALKGKQCGERRPHGPEARAKISAAQKGRKRTPEEIAKMVTSKKGWRPSPESIEKTASKLRGRKRPPEVIARCVATRLKNKQAMAKQVQSALAFPED